jgi:hypothetical protein
VALPIPVEAPVITTLRLRLIGGILFAMPAPTDANVTRGTHFRRLVRSPWTLSLGSTAAILAFVAGTAVAGPAVGAAALLAALLVALGIVFWLADSRAADDFFAAYASARKLTLAEGERRLQPLTELLRKGDRRRASRLIRGRLPGGLEGLLAHYEYEEDHRDSEGRTHTTTYRFTVVTAAAPGCAHHLPVLLCHRRSGPRMLDRVEDTFRRNRRLELESEVLDQRYEIFASPDAEPNWLRQLFSPSFILWLGAVPLGEFFFELERGQVCAAVEGTLERATEMDVLCEAAATVVRRLEEESQE